jgi:hypothetical protein
MASTEIIPATFGLALALIAVGYIVVMLVLNKPIVPGERRGAIMRSGCEYH